MRRSTCFILLSLLLILPAEPGWAQDRSQGFTYVFTIHEDGWIDIYANFSSKEPGRAWILVPRYHEYELRVLSGVLLKKEVKEAFLGGTRIIFYNNFTFSFTSNTAIELEWGYRYGALIVEPVGTFYSTYIGYDRSYPCSILVRIPSSFNITSIYVCGRRRVREGCSSIERSEDYTNLYFYSSELPDNMIRIVVTFNVTGGEFSEVRSGGLRVVVPSRYVEVAENITRIYNMFIDRILEVTSSTEMEITATLFVPQSLEEMEVMAKKAVERARR